MDLFFHASFTDTLFLVELIIQQQVNQTSLDQGWRRKQEENQRLDKKRCPQAYQLARGSNLFLVQIWSIPVILASLLVKEATTK